MNEESEQRSSGRGDSLRRFGQACCPRSKQKDRIRPEDSHNHLKNDLYVLFREGGFFKGAGEELIEGQYDLIVEIGQLLM